MTFSKFSVLLHIYSSKRNFFVFIKFSYLQPFREIMGGQTKRQFSTKNDATGQKNVVFFHFLFCCTSTHRDETFLLLPKFHIFSCSEKSWGDKIVLRQQQRTTTTNNNEQQTPRTIIIARQDSFRILGLIETISFE